MASKAFPRIVTALLLLTLALPALAGSLADRWRAGLKEVDQKLRAQQWEAAREQARKVADQILIMEGVGPHEGASYSLAVVSAFQAIAEAGLGHEDAADWYWATALNLSPDIVNTDLTPYGPPAAGLRARQVRFTNTDSQSPAGPEAGTAGEKPMEGVQPPEVLRKVKPKCPGGFRQMRSAGRVTVEAIIGEDGVPRHPRVLTIGGVPALKYVALDSLREWLFKPARLEGKPVKVYYVLTVNFGV
jgi:hypothetical protein